MDTIKTLKRGKVDTAKLDNVLAKLEEKLTNKEVQHLPVDKGKADVSELDTVLEKMGPDFSDEPSEGLAPSWHVQLSKLLGEVPQVSAETVDIRDLDSILRKMDIKLTKEEVEELKRNLSVDDKGKTDLDSLVNILEVASGGEIDISAVESALKDAERERVSREQREQKSFPAYGMQVDVRDLDSLLGNMTFKLTPEESPSKSPDYGRNIGDDMKTISEYEEMEPEIQFQPSELVNYLPTEVQEKVEADKFMDKAKAFTGKRIHSDDMKGVLGDMKIEVTDEELKSLRDSLPFVGGEVKLDNMDSVLKNLGVKLTPKEQERLMEYLPSSESSHGKISFNQLLDAVAEVIGREVNIKDIKDTLEQMGLELTDEECSHVESMLPINASGMVYQNRLLEDVLASKNGIVDVASIDRILQHMGMKLTEMEREDLTEKLPVDETEKVELRMLLNLLKAYTGKKVDVNDLPTLLRDMGIELTEREEEMLFQALPKDDAGMVYHNRMLEEVKSMKGGMVKVNNLDTVLGSLGIELTDKERESLAENLPLTANGKIHLDKVLEVVDAITGGDVDMTDMGYVLKEMGITLSDKEHKALLEQLPVSENKKVHKNRIMDELKSLNRGTISINKIDKILKNMGCKLTNEEIRDLKQSMPADVHGKIAVKTLFNRLSAFTGPKVDVRFLPAMMSKMGLELTDKEQMKLIRELPVDESGKIYKNRLLNGVKSFKGGKVKKSKIDTVLEGMGIKLTEKELARLKENLPDSDNGTVNFQDLMDEVKTLTGNEENIKEVKNILEDMGVELTQQEYTDLLENLPVDVDGNFYHNRLMDTLKSLKGGKADVNKLDSVMKNMGMKVTETEWKDMTKSLPVDDGQIEMRKLVDAMKAFTGNKIALSDLQDILGSMGIELTEEMLSKLQESLPVDDAEMVFQKRLLNEVKSLKGGKVDVNNNDTILDNMGIELTEVELKDLQEALPVDAHGQVELPELMDKVKTLTGGEIDVSDVRNTLKNMGISLEEKEMLKLLKHLPVNEDGKVYQNRLMDSLKFLKGGTVSANKLDSLLERMGIEVEEKELDNLIQNLQRNVDGSVSLRKVMDEVKTISGNKVDGSNLKSIKSYLRSLGIELTDAEYSDLKKTLPTDAAGKLYQNNVLDAVKSLKGGTVDLRDLDKALGNMGIELTEKESKILRDNLPVEAGEKIELRKLLDEVNVLRGESIDMDDLEDILENMGLELTEKEFLKLVRKLQADAGRKTYHKRLLEGLKTLPEGKVKAGKVDKFLKNMRINISEKELKDLTQSLPVSADGKVDIKNIMNEAKVFTGEKIDVSNLENRLGNLGIEFNDSEYMKLLKTLPVDDNGTVHWARVLKELKSLRGGTLDVKSLKSFLDIMGIELANKEVEELRDSLPVDANGKVDLIKVMDGAKTFTGEKIGIDDVKTVLKNMGLEYKDEEFSKLMENLQFDDNGKIFQNKLLEKVKSLKDGQVSTSNLKPLLEKLGILLKDNEYKDLVQNLPAGVLRKVSLDTLMKKLKAFTGDKVDSSDLRNILKNLGIELTEKEQERLLKTLPADDSGKVYYNRLLKGVKSVNEGKVHVNSLDNLLKRLGINLSEEEFAKLSEDLPVDAHGKTDLGKVMDRLKAATGGEVDNKNVETVISKMGIELSDSELSKLMENLPFDDDGKVFKNRLLEVVKSLKGGRVDANNLNTVLNNMGVKLSNPELRDLSQSMHVGVDEKIPLQTLLEMLKDFTGERIEPSDVHRFLANLYIELTDKELENLLKTLPLDDTGKFHSNRLLKGVKDLKGGKIKKDGLHSSLENMGIKLSMEEFAEVTKNLETDENVSIKNLEGALSNVGIKLTNKEIEDLTKSLPVGADNKVHLKTLQDEAKAFTGEKIDSSDLQSTLKTLGIELSNKDLKQLLKTLPVDDNEKVFQNRLLKDLRNSRRE
uniref:uncharacterized protein LOC125407977 isoform X2 n=1 Tax=Myodes glareolus TaxID=447135 RepID=UPI0020201605|nr:uncharacterized protein LOC125407977 isoform X2 [Myodes glareolus]